MGWLDDFSEEMLVTVKITGTGTITDFDASGQPIYGAGEVKHNSLAAVWQGSASKSFGLDRVTDPGVYQIILDPENITGILSETDKCEITINGTLRDFKITIPNDIMGMGEVMQLTGEIEVYNG